MKEFTEFKLWMYTDVLFGKDTEKQVAQKIRQHGGHKVMLVYGGGSIKKIGLYQTVVEALTKDNIPFVELGGVQPNPRRSLAEKGLEMAIRENVDFMLGLGGASSIDTAKAIALGLANDGVFWDFYRGKAPQKMAKVGTIHTISAAGSEMSGSTVLVDDVETHLKKGLMYPFVVRPVFAIMNPELTYTVPANQTAAGAADILSHTLERYFTSSSSFLADQFATGLMRSVVKYAPVALADPNNYEARAELMLAGGFSHNGITAVGRADQPWIVHGLEAYISGTYDTPHGAGLALLMPAWLQYIAENGDADKVARVAQFGVEVFDVQPDMQDVKAVALEGIRRFRAWNQSIGMPLTLSDMHIPASDLQKMIDNSRYGPDGVMKGYMSLDKKAVEAIFRSILP